MASVERITITKKCFRQLTSYIRFMKALIFVFLIVFSHNVLSQQSNTIDSLENKYNGLEGKEKFDFLLFKFLPKIEKAKPEKALQILNEAEKLTGPKPC